MALVISMAYGMVTALVMGLALLNEHGLRVVGLSPAIT